MDELKNIALVVSGNPPTGVDSFGFSFCSGSNGIKFSSRVVLLEILQICDFYYSNSSGQVLPVSNANINLVYAPNTFVLNDAITLNLDAGANVLASIQYLIRGDGFFRFEIPVNRIVMPEQRLQLLAVNVRTPALTGVNDFFQCSIRIFWREL